MPKTKQQKESDLKELTDKLKGAKSAVFAEYRGTSVKNMDKVRKALRSENVFAKVYKITLLKKALEGNGINAGSIDYKTPVIFAISQEEETTPARLVKSVSKDVTTINILAGVLDGQLATRDQLMALADLPSREVLLGQVVGTINAPVSGFVNVLAGTLRSLMNVLNAAAQKS